MKVELNEKMKEIVAIRPKVYIYLMEHRCVDKEIRVTKNCVIIREIKFQNFVIQRVLRV